MTFDNISTKWYITYILCDILQDCQNVIWFLAVHHGRLKGQKFWRKSQVAPYPNFISDPVTPSCQLLVDWSVNARARQCSGQLPTQFPWPLPPSKDDCHRIGKPSVDKQL